MESPGILQFMGSQRVGNNLAAGQQHSRRIDEIITDRTSRTGQGIQQSLLLYTRFYQHVCLQRWSFVQKKKKKHGLPRRRSDEESTYQWKRCKRYGFNPWIRKIPWRRTWQLTPIFLPGKFHEQEPGGLQSMGSWRILDTTEHTHTILELFIILVLWSLKIVGQAGNQQKTTYRKKPFASWKAL